MAEQTSAPHILGIFAPYEDHVISVFTLASLPTGPGLETSAEETARDMLHGNTLLGREAVPGKVLGAYLGVAERLFYEGKLSERDQLLLRTLEPLLTEAGLLSPRAEEASDA